LLSSAAGGTFSSFVAIFGKIPSSGHDLPVFWPIWLCGLREAGRLFGLVHDVHFHPVLLGEKLYVGRFHHEWSDEGISHGGGVPISQSGNVPEIPTLLGGGLVSLVSETILKGGRKVDVILGIDLSTSSLKMAFFDRDGK
jgi:hypothetical protein